MSGYSVPFYPRTTYTAAPDGSRIGLLTTAVSGPEAGTFRVGIYDAFGGEIFSAPPLPRCPHPRPCCGQRTDTPRPGAFASWNDGDPPEKASACGEGVEEPSPTLLSAG